MSPRTRSTWSASSPSTRSRRDAVVAEVVADDVRAVVERGPRDPGAEAAEDAGDEEALGSGWLAMIGLSPGRRRSS